MEWRDAMGGSQRWANSACFVRNAMPQAMHLDTSRPPQYIAIHLQSHMQSTYLYTNISLSKCYYDAYLSCTRKTNRIQYKNSIQKKKNYTTSFLSTKSFVFQHLFGPLKKIIFFSANSSNHQIIYFDPDRINDY